MECQSLILNIDRNINKVKITLDFECYLGQSYLDVLNYIFHVFKNDIFFNFSDTLNIS